MLSKFIAKSKIQLKGQDKLLILLKMFWKAVHGILCSLMQIDFWITLRMSKSMFDDTVFDLKNVLKMILQKLWFLKPVWVPVFIKEKHD